MSSKRADKPAYAVSRRRRLGIFVLCLLLLAILIWLDHSPSKRRYRQPAGPGKKAATRDLAKYHRKAFTVTKVVDGDTLDIGAPDGKYEHTRIRLLGIDTPETKNPETGPMYFGPQAAEFTKKVSLGKKVTVCLDGARTRGHYGRLLAYVKLPNGKFLNEALLTEGCAYADLRFRHKFYNRYKRLESTARRADKGLWREVTHEQMPEWKLKF